MCLTVLASAKMVESVKMVSVSVETALEENSVLKKVSESIFFR